MREEFLLIQQELEENGGEFTDEIKEKFMSLDEDLEALIFNVYNIISEVEGSIERREAEIERLRQKTNSSSNTIEGWRKFLLDIVKMRKTTNKSGNPSVKVNDITFTVNKSESVNVTDAFKDERFIKYKLGEPLPLAHKTAIENFLKKYTQQEEIKFTKDVDKKALKKALEELKEEEEIEGAEIIEKEKLTIRG